MSPPSSLRLHSAGYRQIGRDCTIQFDGQTIPAIEGETIAAALAAAYITTFGQDRGRQRAAFCGMGACMECMVSVDGMPGQRACLTRIRAGQVVLTSPSTTGFPGKPAEQETADVIVVGAGPAGLTAARDLATHGIKVVVLDERPSAGGQYFKPLASGFVHRKDNAADSQFKAGTALVDSARDAGVQIRSGTTVWDIEAGQDGFVLYTDSSDTAMRWQARRVILATGATERPLPVPGWTLPGVMATGAAQTLSRSYRVAPGQRILIAGNGPLNLQLAASLAADGASVVAVAEAAPSPTAASLSALSRLLTAGPAQAIQGLAYLTVLRRHGVPLHFNSLLTRVEGTARVEAAILSRLDSTGLPIPGSEQHIAVDTICMGYGFQPNLELLQILGATMIRDYRGHAGGSDIPLIDSTGQTSVPGLFVAGDCSGIWGAAVAQTSGAMVAEKILADLVPAVAQPAHMARLDRRLLRERRFQDALWQVFHTPAGLRTRPPGDAVLCRCENINAAVVSATCAQRDDLHSLSDVKRATRCGMGRCQGRLCSANLSQSVGINAAAERLPSQSPAKPVTLPALAGLVTYMGDATTVAPVAPASSAHTAAGPVADMSADVAIIGGGIIGLCTALALADHSVDVVLIDSALARGSASFANAGSLHAQILSYAFPVLEGDGVQAAVELLRMQRHSIGLWRQLSARLDVDIEMKVTGGLVVAETPGQVSKLRQKVALENAAGGDISLISGDEARRMAPMLSDHILAASYAADEGKLNPLLAAMAVARLARTRGVRFLENAPVSGMLRDGKDFSITTQRGKVRAPRVVNAAGGWANEIAQLVGDTIPVRATPLHMMVTEAAPVLSDLLVAHVSERLTMKQAMAGNLIIGGGWRAIATESGTLRASAPRLAGNLAVAARVLPTVSSLAILRSWVAVNSGTDGRPVLHESSRESGLFHAVTMNGMTLGPAFGQACADLVLGRTPQNF